MLQNKNIKLISLVFLLFPFVAHSVPCELTFQTETRSKFSKWMSQQVLGSVVEHYLENNTNRVYQVQYKEFPFSNIRHTSNWVSYEGLMQFVEALKKLSIHAGIHPATQYRIRYKPKSSNQAETAQEAKPKDTAAQTKEGVQVLDQKVSDFLNLEGTRLIYLKNILKKNNILTMRDLLEKSERDLFYMRGIGRKSVETIKKLLAEKGLALSEYDSVVPPRNNT